MIRRPVNIYMCFAMALLLAAARGCTVHVNTSRGRAAFPCFDELYFERGGAARPNITCASAYCGGAAARGLCRLRPLRPHELRRANHNDGRSLARESPLDVSVGVGATIFAGNDSLSVLECVLDPEGASALAVTCQLKAGRVRVNTCALSYSVSAAPTLLAVVVAPAALVAIIFVARRYVRGPMRRIGRFWEYTRIDTHIDAAMRHFANKQQ